MARNAIIRDAGMIESRWFEDARVMTDTAILIGRDMIGFLRRGKPSIVTGTAVIHDAHVIKGRRLESGSDMADAAIVIGRHVEIGLAGGGEAVVAACAIVDDTLVFETGIGEFRRHMTDRAILQVSTPNRDIDRNVGRILLGIRTGRDDAIVAAGAIVDNTAVIKHRWRKGTAGRVADIAILGGHYMADVHSFRRARAIGYMTGITTQRRHCGVGVIDEGVEKIAGVMADCAIGRGDRVIVRGGGRRLASGAQQDEFGTAVVA